MRVARAGSTLSLAAALACTSSPFTSPKPDPAPADVHLDPPAAGEGFQFAPEPFDVPPGTDQQNCYFYQIPGTGTDPVWVDRFVVAQNVGTHHMNVFRVKTIVNLDPANGRVQTSRDGLGECFQSHNWADWPLVVNSQEGGHVEWKLPEGVAQKFMPGEWVMLQSHYVNAGTQKTPGRAHVFVNFHTTPASSVRHELGTLFATKQSIRVCQHDARSRFAGTCQFNAPDEVRIVAANGHFHSRGREFQMFAWDGTSQVTPPMEDRFYLSEAWNDPPMRRSPDLDQRVVAHGGIWYTCEFQWAPPSHNTCDGLNEKDHQQLGTPEDAYDCCYTFGGPVDWAEHCNAFVYYYPKQDNVVCY